MMIQPLYFLPVCLKFLWIQLPLSFTTRFIDKWFVSYHLTWYIPLNKTHRVPSFSLECSNSRPPLGRGKTPNAERRTQNAERRMHCLLSVSFTCVCLRLAFICWKGQHFIVVGPFQQIKANRKQTQVKLTASKQCIRRSAFCVRRSAFGVRRSAFGVRRSAFGVRRSAFGVRRSAFGVRRSAFGVRRFTPAVRHLQNGSSRTENHKASSSIAIALRCLDFLISYNVFRLRSLLKFSRLRRSVGQPE